MFTRRTPGISNVYGTASGTGVTVCGGGTVPNDGAAYRNYNPV